MIRIALVGAKGYVGTALRSALGRNSEYKVIPVTRETYEDAQKDAYDVVINSAMPSGRFWAKMNPKADFEETVGRTADLLYAWNFKKFVQISTVSARSQLDTVYGRHKAAAEVMANRRDSLIVRLGAMYADTLAKGVLIDMLEGKKIFVHGESRYSFAPLEFAAGWIAQHLLARSGIVEVGAKNSISLQELADYLGGKFEFEGLLDHQEIENPEDSFPDARGVLQFLDRARRMRYNMPQ